MEQLKVLSIKFHEKLGTFLYSVLNCSFRKEDNSITFAYMMITFLWYKIVHCFQQDDDIYPYDSCLNRLHDLIVNEDEQDCDQWWTIFWVLVAPKFPNIAASHLSQLLGDVIDRKKIMLVSFLPV